MARGFYKKFYSLKGFTSLFIFCFGVANTESTRDKDEDRIINEEDSNEKNNIINSDHLEDMELENLQKHDEENNKILEDNDKILEDNEKILEENKKKETDEKKNKKETPGKTSGEKEEDEDYKIIFSRNKKDTDGKSGFVIHGSLVKAMIIENPKSKEEVFQNNVRIASFIFNRVLTETILKNVNEKYKMDQNTFSLVFKSMVNTLVIYKNKFESEIYNNLLNKIHNELENAYFEQAEKLYSVSTDQVFNTLKNMQEAYFCFHITIPMNKMTRGENNDFIIYLKKIISENISEKNNYNIVEIMNILQNSLLEVPVSFMVDMEGISIKNYTPSFKRIFQDFQESCLAKNYNKIIESNPNHYAEICNGILIYYTNLESSETEIYIIPENAHRFTPEEISDIIKTKKAYTPAMDEIFKKMGDYYVSTPLWNEDSCENHRKNISLKVLIEMFSHYDGLLTDFNKKEEDENNSRSSKIDENYILG